MSEIGAFEAKTQFSKLLERARNGETFTITHRGQAVAQLVPFQGAHDPAQTKAILARLRSGARKHRGAPISMADIFSWRDEGRR